MVGLIYLMFVRLAGWLARSSASKDTGLLVLLDWADRAVLAAFPAAVRAKASGARRARSRSPAGPSGHCAIPVTCGAGQSRAVLTLRCHPRPGRPLAARRRPVGPCRGRDTLDFACRRCTLARAEWPSSVVIWLQHGLSARLLADRADIRAPSSRADGRCRFQGHGRVQRALPRVPPAGPRALLGRRRADAVAVEPRVRSAEDIDFSERTRATVPPPPLPGPPGTAPPRRRPGAGCTSSWPAAPAGRTTAGSCPSSRAPSSGCKRITCPATRPGSPAAVVLGRRHQSRRGEPNLRRKPAGRKVK
jgi:hypothetical protein